MQTSTRQWSKVLTTNYPTRRATGTNEGQWHGQPQLGHPFPLCPGGTAWEVKLTNRSVSTQIIMLPKGQIYRQFTQMKMLPGDRPPSFLRSGWYLLDRVIISLWVSGPPLILRPSPCFGQPKRQERRRTGAGFVAALGGPTSVPALDRSPDGVGGGWSAST